jgi:hypothetical protein
VRVWCHACRDDVEGCFGGNTAFIGGRFSSLKEAHQAAVEYCGTLPSGYRIEECSDKEAGPMGAENKLSIVG